MKLNELAIIGVAATTVVSCTPAKTEYASYELYPVRSGSLTEMEYTPAATQFTLWAPTADEVRLMLFEAGDGGHAYETISMESSEEGTWKTKVEKDLIGKFYTFNVKINDKWLGDTPGINAKAVGVNGKRAAIIDMKSTDPYKPDVRIREFKQMVQALHKAGIRVVLDVVYNHTFNTSDSNFERTVPGYFYRQRPDGTYADGSACGNETASNRPMMRKYMIESVLHWINEYHIDGFRFDLMGIHDIETMNEIRKAATSVDPTIFIYGEGWAASAPQMAEDSLAMKANTYKMPGVAAFSDEMRDALRGPFNDNHQGAFLAGLPGGEESIKFGIVGAIRHPQVNNDSVNYSKAPWAEQPTQMISYVSCHDDMCLVDRLKASIPGITPVELAKLDKLAQTAVFTSQGVPFIYAGEEVMRDKKGVHNSFESPDSINAIDWRRKAEHADVFAYYKGLIQLRKKHPAFRMGDADLVRKHLEFLPVDGSNVVVYRLKENANGDAWGDIIVVLNARKEPAKLTVPEGKYTVVCKDGFINEQGLGTLYGPEVVVPAQSALIMYK